MMNKDEIELFETTGGKEANVLWEYLAKGWLLTGSGCANSAMPWK